MFLSLAVTPTLAGEGTATRSLPRDPCDISISLSRIRLDNVCVWLLFEIIGGAELPLRSKRNRNPNRSNRKTKNRIGHQIRKPVNIFRENRKSDAKKRKICKPQGTPKPGKPKFFSTKTEKPI